MVLLVAGFGFTALVTPGFLRTGGARQAGTAAGDSTSTPAKSSGPEALIQHLVRAANAKDVDGMSELACSEVGPNVRSAIADIGTTDGAELAGSTSVSGNKVRATLAISINGGARQVDVTGIRNGNEWCWRDISAQGGGARTSPSEGKAFVKKVISNLNKGDTTALNGQLCEDSNSKGDVDSLAGRKVNVEIDTSELMVRAEFVATDLKGTLDGDPVSAARISAFYLNGSWCAFTIFVL